MSDNKSTIIIRGKRGGEEEHGSHGMWKIAYADFMTAMMAFFLMMWLTGSVAENVRKGLSVYFAPLGASQNVLGTDSILEGGENLEEMGVMEGMTLEEYIFPKVPNYSIVQKKDNASKTFETEGNEVTPDNPSPEQVIFEEAEKALRGGLINNEHTKDYGENVDIKITPEGLKIELIDRDSKNMFAIGSPEMEPHTRKLLQEVAKIIQVLPNSIRITGHTDARPYGINAKYDNWNLSADRALMSRRELQELGVDASKFSGVIGKAHSELLDPDAPLADCNRRISIVVLRQTQNPEEEQW